MRRVVELKKRHAAIYQRRALLSALNLSKAFVDRIFVNKLPPRFSDND